MLTKLTKGKHGGFWTCEEHQAREHLAVHNRESSNQPCYWCTAAVPMSSTSRSQMGHICSRFDLDEAPASVIDAIKQEILQLTQKTGNKIRIRRHRLKRQLAQEMGLDPPSKG
jgi:hypothetical protein